MLFTVFGKSKVKYALFISEVVVCDAVMSDVSYLKPG